MEIPNRAQEFVFRDQPFKLPIDQEDVVTFSNAVEPYDPPSGWLNRILSAMQYVDYDTFKEDLDQLAEIATKVLGNHPYALRLTHPLKSDVWIYQQLLQAGLPPATNLIDNDAVNRMDEKNMQEIVQKYANEPRRRAEELLHYRGAFSLWKNNIPQDNPICAFDDFAISGAQIREGVFGLSGKRDIQPDRYKAFLCYATEYALDHLDRYQIATFLSGSKVSNLDSALRPEDIQFITTLDSSVRPQMDFITDSPTLFWTWYKVPDNIPPVFIGDGLPPLIRPERFQPPYKKG